jgi:hypothetical protein
VNVLDDEPYNDVHELQTAVAKLALQDNGTKSFTARTADRGTNSNSRRRNDFMLLLYLYLLPAMDPYYTTPQRTTGIVTYKSIK